MRRFSRFANRYKASSTHARGFDLDLLLQIADPRSEWQALDIATGGGHTALRLAPRIASVIAADLTPAMLSAAAGLAEERKQFNIKFHVLDAEQLPYREGIFDLVTCRIAPHHFPNAQRFLQEGARVLRTGGMFLVQDHVLPSEGEAAAYVDSFEKLRDPSHHRAFNLGEWLSMFEHAGLALECAVQLVKRHDFYEWALRQDCDKKTQDHLLQMLRTATPAVKAWMRPENLDSTEASFVNHHIILAGRKPDIARTTHNIMKPGLG